MEKDTQSLHPKKTQERVALQGQGKQGRQGREALAREERRRAARLALNKREAQGTQGMAVARAVVPQAMAEALVMAAPRATAGALATAGPAATVALRGMVGLAAMAEAQVTPGREAPQRRWTA